MRYVPIAKGDLITLTIGGNDLLADQNRYLSEGLGSFDEEHRRLLSALRESNPNSLVIVGNIYAPQFELPGSLMAKLDEANDIIAENVKRVDARLADIRGTFRGHEDVYLCYEIEPSLQGATVIAGLFRDAARKAGVL
jgi:lysophospholipase L1-like esterase